MMSDQIIKYVISGSRPHFPALSDTRPAELAQLVWNQDPAVRMSYESVREWIKSKASDKPSVVNGDQAEKFICASSRSVTDTSSTKTSKDIIIKQPKTIDPANTSIDTKPNPTIRRGDAYSGGCLWWCFGRKGSRIYPDDD